MKKIKLLIYTSFILTILIILHLLINPIYLWVTKSSIKIDISEENLKKHVSYLTETVEQRDYKNTKRLNEIAQYIFTHFQESGCDSVTYQPYTIWKDEYKNVICSFDGENPQKIVIWAHYDVDGSWYLDENPEGLTFRWADDNASWVAGLLELTRLVGKDKNNLKNSIEFVAYTLEELPYFAGNNMWSYIHAKSLKDQNIDIQYMISLEMIWYFSDEKIQKYPLRFLSRIYPSKWDFIALIWQLWDMSLKDIKYNMLANSEIDVWSINAPDFIHGVSFSDHRSYWDLWYKAYMITDTSFLRNKYYHTLEDTIDTLDFTKMKEVVKGVYGVVMN